MKVAFYSPIKPPGHPVPSGDRLMARLLIRALEHGHADVDVVSELRTFSRTPTEDGMRNLVAASASEVERIAARWREFGRPDVFLTYHPYYKAPDLIGVDLARRHDIPYLTVEASYSRRRDEAGWREMQAFVGAAVSTAAVNISMTERDREGLLANFPDARTAMLAPFIDTAPYGMRPPQPMPGRLVTVAMMRPGDKFDSYRMLASALGQIDNLDWTLSIIGDGPARPEVEALFAGLERGRIAWHGQMDQSEIAEILARSRIFAWPGCGEAYGLAYLEAQAAGLPVVAQATAGVPSVVMDGHTGILTPAGDVVAYSAAIRQLLTDDALRLRLATGARRFVSDERSLPAASARLIAIIREFAGASR